MTAARVAVVTGAGTGIGKAIAAAFAANGDRVVACGRHLPPLEQAVRDAAGLPGAVIAECCDVGDPAAVAALVERVLARERRIDVLVNNAGVYGPIGPAHENPVEEWIDAIRINLTGVFLMTRAVVPAMVRQGGGAIVNLSGGGATGPKPCYSAYAAGKAGVVRFTETVAEELRAQRIRVNAIAPGFIATRFHEQTLAAGARAGPELEATRKKMQSGGDDPRRAAELAVFLAGPQAEGITGKLVSAVFDDWSSPGLAQALRESKDLYTLRRIDRFQFQEVRRP